MSRSEYLNDPDDAGHEDYIGSADHIEDLQLEQLESQTVPSDLGADAGDDDGEAEELPWWYGEHDRDPDKPPLVESDDDVDE